jgi:competence protein ComEA
MTKLLKSILLSIGIAFLMASVAQAKDESKSGASTSASAPSATSKSGALLDINTASEKELAALPKIGDARAKAIVKGRPYKAKDELVDKKILTQDVYASIKDRIIARQKPAGADKKK